jgi:hypothetical protein
MIGGKRGADRDRPITSREEAMTYHTYSYCDEVMILELLSLG